MAVDMALVRTVYFQQRCKLRKQASLVATLLRPKAEGQNEEKIYYCTISGQEYIPGLEGIF
jgi:hypothetical protein